LLIVILRLIIYKQKREQTKKVLIEAFSLSSLIMLFMN